MELKSPVPLPAPPLLRCSNRTFMELKCIEVALLSDAIVGSNRTFMELKCKLAKMTVENLGF